MRHIVRIAGALAMPLMTSGCARMGPRQGDAHHLLERNYITRPSGDASLLYEAQAVTHIFLKDGLPDAYSALATDRKSNVQWAWRAAFTPMFRLRQLQDSSAAVRTPSFMPRLTFDILHLARMDAHLGADSTPRFDWVWINGLRLVVQHHSNGQAGCFRDGWDPKDVHSNDCVPHRDLTTGALYDTNRVALNRANGDFSTTYFGAAYLTNWLHRSGSVDRMADRSASFLGEVDWHVPGVFGDMTPDQRELYGTFRGKVALELMQATGRGCGDDVARPCSEAIGCVLAGRTRLNVEGEHVIGALGPLAGRISPSITPWRYSVEVSHAFDRLLGSGVFVRYHDGQDYLNIGFAKRRTIWMIGMMLDLSGADRISTK